MWNMTTYLTEDNQTSRSRSMSVFQWRNRFDSRNF